ncbi:hypothetical protein Tco_0203032 [Tanacetum coccineum]
MRGSLSKEEQIFLDDLTRLQIQEKEANEEAEALRTNLEQDIENLVTQGEAEKSSSTNVFSTVSTTAKASGTNFVNTVSIPVGSGYHQKGRKPSQNDKTEHGMENTVQNQGQSPKKPKSESIFVTPPDGAWTEYVFEGVTSS